MVLVDTDPVEAQRVGVLELVHVLVVHDVAGRIEEAAVDVDPDGVVFPGSRRADAAGHQA